MSEQIGIKISAKKLSPERFLEAIKAFISVVEGVGNNLSSTPIKWNVEVAKGSAVFKMRPENPSRESKKVIHAVRGGFRSFRSGIRTTPFGFSYKEVVAIRPLAALTEDEGIESVCIKNGGKWEDFPQTVIPVVDAILERQTHIAFGSIEGEIVAFSRRQGFICTMDDPIYDREIVCFLQSPETQAKAIEGFQKQARVLVGGLIHYSKEGFPVNISADTIRVFSPESELPTLEDVQAIYRLK